MNKEVYLSSLECIKTYDNKCEVSANIIFKKNMSYEDFIKLQNNLYFILCDKEQLDKYKIVLDKIKEIINYYAVEDEDYSKIYNQEEQEIMKLLEGIE